MKGTHNFVIGSLVLACCTRANRDERLPREPLPAPAPRRATAQ
jgi:hypothetical protein